MVTRDKAALWTDGRYFLQAEQELDCNWELMRNGTEPKVSGGGAVEREGSALVFQSKASRRLGTNVPFSVLPYALVA